MEHSGGQDVVDECRITLVGRRVWLAEHQGERKKARKSNAIFMLSVKLKQMRNRSVVFVVSLPASGGFSPWKFFCLCHLDNHKMIRFVFERLNIKISP